MRWTPLGTIISVRLSAVDLHRRQPPRARARRARAHTKRGAHECRLASELAHTHARAHAHTHTHAHAHIHTSRNTQTSWFTHAPYLLSLLAEKTWGFPSQFI